MRQPDAYRWVEYSGIGGSPVTKYSDVCPQGALLREKMTPLWAESPLIANTEIAVQLINAGAQFQWSWRRVGFGQISFRISDGEVDFNTAGLDPESARQVLHAMADQLAMQYEAQYNTQNQT